MTRIITLSESELEIITKCLRQSLSDLAFREDISSLKISLEIIEKLENDLEALRKEKNANKN